MDRISVTLIRLIFFAILAVLVGMAVLRMFASGLPFSKSVAAGSGNYETASDGTISPDLVIPGGRSIGVKMDVEEDGHVFISGLDLQKCQRALDIVDTIVNDPEPGSYYNGRVTRLMDFGACVEIAPGKEGLVHISRLDVKRTEKVTDVVNVGDIVKVKVLEIDDKGRLNLSRRDALIDLDGAVPENDISEKPRREHRDRDRRPRREHRE